ncbi:MAG: hypothetical protein H0W82_01850 [Actinobacteria bacterium]|nr:hypothetical protein [Actinomycetota bacterium]
MNRWTASALGVLVVGVAVSFLVVPYDDGACPTATACQAYGSVPRITSLILTALVALAVAAIGAPGTPNGRP